jgi:diguanylate cyclase (GGDEF)-like protein
VTPLKNEHGEITHFISTGKDITERMQIQERLQYLAHHDILTDLPNRFLFIEHLKQAIARQPRTARHMAVLFLDLDRFKIVNDTLGHGAGDLAIRLAGERIREALRSGDTIARLGGDEFAILLEDLASPDDVPQVIQKIQLALTRPFVLQDREFFLSTSIGVSLHPQDGADPLTLLRNADSAMYRAKESGRNSYCFYSREMSAKAFERQTLEASLRRALERGEFSLHYQPQIELAGGAPVGFEALLRWEHADLGTVSPAQFIPLAEETGLIVAIDDWVLRTAVAQLAAWLAAGHPRLTIAVNLSGRSFALPDLPQRVTRILQERGVPAELLELEITESVVMHSSETNVSALESLKRQGLRLAIDDFGTGYSSLSYLKRFSIDTLKIDRAFIRDIAADPDDRAIVDAVIALARSLELRVIAEGVETEEQLALLRRHGCHLAQGFLFARPLPPAEAEAWLRAAAAGDSQPRRKA